MKPPGDTDTDGSSSNCTAFFISTVHDLSLYETHAPRSPPPYTRDSFFSSPSISCNAFISLRPTESPLSFCRPSSFLFCTLAHPLYLCFCPPLCVCLSFCLCLSAAALNPPPLPGRRRLISLPLLVLSLVQMCPWSVVAWLGDNRSDFETGGWQPCCH